MRNIFYSLTGIMLLLGITACSEEERYATSVVKEIQLFLDDEPWAVNTGCLLYTSPSPRDRQKTRMPSSA